MSERNGEVKFMKAIFTKFFIKPSNVARLEQAWFLSTPCRFVHSSQNHLLLCCNLSASSSMTFQPILRADEHLSIQATPRDINPSSSNNFQKPTQAKGNMKELFEVSRMTNFQLMSREILLQFNCFLDCIIK